MKKYGSVFEYKQERDADLMRAYREDIASCKVIHLPEVWKRMANMPSSRFWVSEERAAIVTRQLMKGEKIEYMRPLKREMFFEIYHRVMVMRKKYPEKSINCCCLEVVKGPAPKFYMSSLSIRVTIYKIKKQWYNEKMKRTVGLIKK